MSTYFLTIYGLAAFDVIIVALLFLCIRWQPVVDRKSRIPTAIALSGFVFHAFVFFEGTILYLQLVTIAAVMSMILAPWPFLRRSSGRGNDGV